MEAEIVPQVLHLHLHELLSLKGCSSEPLAEKAEAGPIPLLAGTGHAEVFLTVQAGLLLRARGRGKHVSLRERERVRRELWDCHRWEDLLVTRTFLSFSCIQGYQLLCRLKATQRWQTACVYLCIHIQDT
jgi:hypothetical protein